MKRIIWIAVAIVLSFSIISLAQETTADHRISIKVQNKVLTLRVVDRSGDPVTDLRPEEFIFYENGKEKRIESVEVVLYGEETKKQYASLLAAPEPDQYNPHQRRQYLIIFDLSYNNRRGYQQSLKAAQKFVAEQLEPNDLLAFGVITALRGFTMVTPFISNHETLQTMIANYDASDFFKNLMSSEFAFQSELDNLLTKEIDDRTSSDEAEDPYKDDVVKQTEMIIDSENIRQGLRAVNYLGMFKYISRIFEHEPVRVNAILFSQGAPLPMFEPYLGFGTNKNAWISRADFFETLSSMEVSNVTYYGVDTSGLTKTGLGASAFGGPSIKDPGAGGTMFQGSGMLYNFSEVTGGKIYYNQNIFDRLMLDIKKQTSAAYLLTFKVDPDLKYGEVNKIEVKVTRPGLRVFHQPAYKAPEEYANWYEDEKRMQLHALVSKDTQLDDMPMAINAQIMPGTEGQSDVAITVELDASRLAFQYDENAIGKELQIFGFLVNKWNEPIEGFDSFLRLTSAEVMEKLNNKRLKYYNVLSAKPGEYKLKIVIRDDYRGNISTEIIPISIPESFENFRLRGPVFMENSADEWIFAFNNFSADQVDPMRSYPFTLRDGRAIARVEAEFASTETGFVYLGIDNAELDEESNNPQIAFDFQLHNNLGESFRVNGLSLRKNMMKPESRAMDSVLEWDFSKSNLPEGYYTLNIALKDKLARKSCQGKVSFTISDN